jgi:hypothetical protein
VHVGQRGHQPVQNRPRFVDLALGLLTYNTGFIFLATSRAAALGVVVMLLCLPLYLLWRKAAETGR